MVPSMLQTLRIKNLAIVDNIRVEFRGGLNAITGETGAGKSILMGALALLLGERAGKEIIRAGEEQCGVEGTFVLKDPSHADAILQALGLPPCEDGRVIIRRIISQSGSARILVNDSPATLQALKRLGAVLVDLHGPHDHQSLLDREFQLAVLDSFGRLEKLRADYASAYSEWRALESRKSDLQRSDAGDVAAEVELLEYQAREIRDANLSENDESELQREHSIIANAKRIGELAGAARSALTEDDASAFNGVAAANRCLTELSQILPEAAEWKTEAESIASRIQDLSDSICRATSNAECDPARLQIVEDRLALIHKLKRKHGGSIKAVLERLVEIEMKLQSLRERDRILKEIDEKIRQAMSSLQSAGDKLSKSRQAAASSMASAITNELKDLGFPHGVFDVSLSAREPGPSGLDDIEFGFAPNRGEPMRPLRAIASSGEISRVMLAIKTVLAEHDRIPVLVFDEIDANVGGEMGIAIGKKLAALAERRQVLCITHLPQVAVYGQTHWVVTKEIKGGRTLSRINMIEGESRVEEIARMLGGRSLTSVALRHAQEMLARIGNE